MIDLSRPWPFDIDGRNWHYFAAGFLAVLVIVSFYDHTLSAYAISQSSDVRNFFGAFTRWGKSDWILIPALVLLALSTLGMLIVRRRVLKLAFLELTQIFAFIFVGVGLPGLIAAILKRAIGRGRPPVFDQVGALGFHPVANNYFYQSFPSGHSTTAFAAAMVLGFLAPRWFGLALLGAIAIAVSRVVTDAHYPTDIIAGMVLGSLGAYAVRAFFASRGWGFVRGADGRIRQRDVIAMARLFSKRKA